MSVAGRTVRVVRPATHRNENDTLTSRYGAALRRYLEELATAPSVAAYLPHTMRQMEDAARLAFEPAFLRGKQQSVGWSVDLAVGDRLWLDAKLRSNAHYLLNSLSGDVLATIKGEQLDHPATSPIERSKVLDRSFGARVENLYGGVLWTVQEAGFRAGAAYLDSLRGSGSLLLQEGEVNSPDPPVVPPPQQKDDKDWLAFLLLLGSLLRQTEAWVVAHLGSIEIGTSYNTQHDARVCSPCGAAEGDYFTPAEPPLPGEVCEGFGNCRCWLELIVRLR